MIKAPILLYSDNDFESIHLDDNATIRKISNEELMAIFGISVEFKDQHPSKILSNNSTRIWSRLEPPANGIDHLALYPYYIIEAKTSDDIVRALHSLRIGGRCTPHCPIGLSEDGEHYFHPMSMVVSARCINKCLIKQSTHAKIINIYKKLKTTYSKKIDIILSRFDTVTNGGANLGVRFVEAVGIIESIVCADANGELSFRFSLLSSYLLNSLGIRTSNKKMQCFYSKRSKIVHSGVSENDPSFNEFIEIFEYCCVVVGEYIENDTDPKNIIKLMQEKLNIPLE